MAENTFSIFMCQVCGRRCFAIYGIPEDLLSEHVIVIPECNFLTDDGLLYSCGQADWSFIGETCLGQKVLKTRRGRAPLPVSELLEG